MGIIEMIIFSFALNLDIFFVSFGVGTMISRAKIIPSMSLIIAFFQSLMPLMGFFIGHLLGTMFGHISTNIGAVLLVLVGIQLIKESRLSSTPLNQQNLFLVYVGVGFEDIMAGVSLGTLSNQIFLFTTIFFLISFGVNHSALYLGKMARKYLHVNIGYTTGAILILMGLLNFFHLI